MPRTQASKPSESSPTAKLQNAPRRPSLRAPIIVAICAAAAFAVHRATEKKESPLNKPPVSETAKNDLFTQSERKSVDRSKLPEELNSALLGLAEVKLISEVFDPKKPNLYLIPQEHFDEGVTPEIAAEIFSLQEDIVRIHHALFSLGLKRQLLEGVEIKTELQHNTARKELGEDVLRSFPTYKETGKVHRAYIAVEGIYGDKIRSVGAESEFERATKIYVDFKEKDENLFPKVKAKILQSMGEELGANNPAELSEALKKVSAKEHTRLAALYVLDNPQYNEFLNAAARRYYDRLQGRNVRFAQAIDEETGNDDTSFILGAGHIDDLTPRLDKRHNIFLLIPKGLDASHMHPFFTNFTEADYRKNILASDLYMFGLGDKPTFSLFE